jgi:hypothetical protein
MQWLNNSDILLECDDNQYGPDCNQTCGKCREDKQCHHINGSCNGGCGPGYKGDNCYQGKTNVLWSVMIDPQRKKITRLHNFLQLQFHHTTVCEFGRFGAGCQDKCSVFCQKSRDCHHVTGFCRGGCKRGWDGEDCLEGSYGYNY